MSKILGGFVFAFFVGFVGYHFMPTIMSKMMFWEMPSPFGVEETAARVQQNIQTVGNGWTLIGLRNPGKAVEQDGGNVLPVIMVETCNTKYSAPILKMDHFRFLSILMPCKISVYKKNDGKTYVAGMNAGVMGMFFGSEVNEVMKQVSADQARFVIFDASKPAPPLIKGSPGASGGGAAAGGGGGC